MCETHPNEQVLRDAFGAFTGGDLEKFASLLADDFVIHVPGKHRLAGSHGREEFLGSVIPTIMEVTDSSLKIEAHEFLGNDGHAIGVYNMSAARGGKDYEWRHVNVYHVRDGRITEVFWNPFDREVVEELLA